MVMATHGYQLAADLNMSPWQYPSSRLREWPTPHVIVADTHLDCPYTKQLLKRLYCIPNPPHTSAMSPIANDNDGDYAIGIVRDTIDFETDTSLYLVETRRLIHISEFFAGMFRFDGTENRSGFFKMTLDELWEPEDYGYGGHVGGKIPTFEMFLSLRFSLSVTLQLIREAKLYELSMRVMCPSLLEKTLTRVNNILVQQHSELMHGETVWEIWGCLELLFRNIADDPKMPESMKMLFAKIFNLRTSRNDQDWLDESLLQHQCVELTNELPELGYYLASTESENYHQPWWSVIGRKKDDVLFACVGKVFPARCTADDQKT
ncbi:hypothetical protein BJ508DRAFT_311256 [Ascobolus immersus RN42]|uniref:Uncharacterized protein n=1 Tax=Ascobolus immersus RN42 TaxID=1160509 RepID=A0A3N4HT96_ASCIM|nr:hypothetical protein BJ508DRAFT_311256 [Ascobolus immersus RN42]